MTKIALNINGTSREIDVDDKMPLLWALRDTLGLTGTKYGCGAGLCGSCTVLVDGEATRSCVTSVSSVSDSSIVTIEGLSEDGSHPVQRAWIAEEVSQCGYCQAGQIMSVVALLKSTSKPSASEIEETMSSVICRCGTYNRIRKAIHRAVGGSR